MKKYFLYIVILLSVTNFSNTLFAQSTNEKSIALNNYLETIIKDTTQVVFIAKEKINSNETLNIFALNEIMIIDSDGNGKGDSTLYKKKDFEIMRDKYKNNCTAGKRFWCNDDFWTKEDFKYKKISLESMSTKKGIEVVLEKYNTADIKVYGFSEPIYYQKYIVFTVITVNMTGSKTRIIIMKKIKDKWIVTHKGDNSNIMN